MKSKETFASLFDSLAYRYDLRPVFDDFLTMTICSFSRNLSTGKSYDEDLYMETIARYDKKIVRELFPKMLALLIVEMEERNDSSSGNDVLGEFYELNFCRKGAAQFFTPWHICEFMASCLGNDQPEREESLRIIDPTCGSGRTLLAAAKHFGYQERYFGIDIDHTCVKMTVLNLFLNGVFHAEVMWGDSLSPDDFKMSYVTSFLPFGIFRIKQKENSHLWHSHKAAFKKQEAVPKPEIILPSKEKAQTGSSSQLQLF
jgi:type I restriction-modification system DNA methylase subunit